MTKRGASALARPFSSGSSTASASAVPGRIGRPPTLALQSIAPGGRVAFRKLRWLLRTAYCAHQHAAVVCGEHTVTRFLDVGDEHGLRGVAHDGDREQSRLACGERTQAKRDHRW